MIHLEDKFGIQISTEFINFIEQEVLPETTIAADTFWAGLAKVVTELTPTNKQLLERRINGPGISRRSDARLWRCFQNMPNS